MQVFYTDQFEGDQAILDQLESKHLVRVLRMREGDPVSLVDGNGVLYRGLVSLPDQNRCIISILSRVDNYLQRDYRLHIAISLLKSEERFEWFLEKATEIGVDEITPVICHRTEKHNLRMERSRKIIMGAMKQSGRARIPIFNEVVSFREFIAEKRPGIKLIPHCETSSVSYITDHLAEDQYWTIMIGPEGDFNSVEIEQAKNEGFREAWLGDAVYRSETAGIMACQIVSNIYINKKNRH